MEIRSSELVPGDIIYLVAGHNVPADARIIESENLEADEAALTGESMPVAKNEAKIKVGASLADRSSCVYLGTQIARGKGLAMVFDTGANIYYISH